MLSETIEMRVSAGDGYDLLVASGILNPNLEDLQLEVWVDLEDSPGYRTQLFWGEVFRDYDDREHYTVNNDHKQHYLYIDRKEEN